MYNLLQKYNIKINKYLIKIDKHDKYNIKIDKLILKLDKPNN